ncbi:hypothetical protein D3C72_1864390 [compost metagenome]
MAPSFWPATKACAAACGDSVVVLTSFSDMPFFFSIQARPKYGAVPGASTPMVLPFRSAKLLTSLRTARPSAP